ncbi:MAG: hypothetical protein K2O89_05140 [Clostridia bacterium]|nr:hypothetical protein [Clostridia bacterium]
MKITIHPMFLAVGLLSALFGGLPIFIICALTALLHECGHIFCAARLGFECKKISLMPFGAAAVCDIEGISPSDEIKLAVSGPLVNLLLCAAVAGLWWFFPETYAYTDLIFYASAGMLVLNLLPAYPLDGGRIAKCVLSGFLKRDKILNLALRIVNIFVVIALIFLYFFAIKNITLLTMAGFLFCSALSKSPPAEKINFAVKKKKKGREIRYVILDENATFKDALRFVDSSRYLVLQLYNDKFLDEITEDELYEKLLTRSIYDKILD